MQKDKVRVYELARELNVQSKDLLDLCRQAGMDVKNQLSSLDPEQRDVVEQLVRKSGGVATAIAPPPAAPPRSEPPKPPPVIPTRVRDLNQQVRPAVSQQPRPMPGATPPPRPAVQTPAAIQPTAQPAAQPMTQPVAQAAPVASVAQPVAQPITQPVAQPVAQPTQQGPVSSPVRPAAQQASPSQSAARPAAPPLQTPPRQIGQPRPAVGGHEQRRREIPRPRPPAGIPGLAVPPRPKPLGPTKGEQKPQQPAAQKPLMRLPPEMLKSPGALNEAAKKELAKDLVEKATQEVVAPPIEEDEDGEPKKGARPGAVKGRDERHKKRSQRAKDRRQQEGADGKRIEYVGEEDDRPLHRLRQRLRQAVPKRGTQPRKGKVPVELPITVRALSESLGVRANDLLRRLMERGQMFNINTVLEPVLAEELALESGAELEIKKPLDPEEQLLKKLQGEDRPEDLAPRAPIVTIMGHVDHGKTSLLDRIRESNVVATEAGGITQHLRAWRVVHGGKPITFLDTPGHEAFTQMRARGANVTDIVVLVIAADDGVMPQTAEAISHAKAAKVPIVVCINKVDLPNANVTKTRSQLYAHELVWDKEGGDVQFVETVANKERARGVNELLEAINLVAEYQLELKANPKKPGQGTCLEAKLSEGEGVVATLLVQDGTLRKGDVVLCGLTYGRVRALYDDLGRLLEEAGPSLPVRITGLDEAPNADDRFQVVPDLALAREITEKRKERLQAAAPVKHATFRLEDLQKAKVAEIKLIVKADVRGSLEAIRKEMEKLAHAEVRVNLLHTAIGGITESDVQLALTSPADTLLVGFNVVPDDRARALADDKGVQIRQYDIIYKLTDDIRAALEGKLKPREEVVHLGRAVVRDTFKISRVGTIAGCYVTQGVVERSARVRLIRDGVVAYPPADRVATIESLRRVKDDVKEVREGYECGIKIAGFDDVKVNDVIEAYRVEQVQRTL